MKDYKYILQPYRGVSTRHTCPSCEHKREFALYIDASTGQMLHPSVGKCNRESKCGYHYSPGEYFKDNPNNAPGLDWKPAYIPQTTKNSHSNIKFLPSEYIPSANNATKSNLYRFFVGQFGEATTKGVFEKYKVGASKHYRNDDGLASAFPQIDINGKLRQVKVIAYNPTTGKRLHKEHPAEKWTSKGYVIDTSMDKVWFAGKFLLNDYEANLQQCLFGEHLIRTAEKLAVVESEKTAMIANLYLPQFVWIATGGKNGCKWTNKDVCKVFAGKTIFLYPDLKCLQEWTEKGEILKSYGMNVHVSRFLEDNASSEDREKGLDIADFLLKDKPQQISMNREQKSTIANYKSLPKNGEQKSEPLNTIGELLEYAYSIGVEKQIKIRGYGY